MENFIIHKADTRGFGDYLKVRARYTFNFANFKMPGRDNFGVLRVLNNDVVCAGKCYGIHSNSNIEIINIVLEGTLSYKDSLGKNAILKKGDVMVMTAGTGIYNYKTNIDKENFAKLLQVWFEPNEKNSEPRSSHVRVTPEQKKNRLQLIASPHRYESGACIDQDAWVYIGTFDEGRNGSYTVRKKGNGIYIFVISGALMVGGQLLECCDGIGIQDTNHLFVTAVKPATEILLIEVSMNVVQNGFKA